MAPGGVWTLAHPVHLSLASLPAVPPSPRSTPNPPLFLHPCAFSKGHSHLRGLQSWLKKQRSGPSSPFLGGKNSGQRAGGARWRSHSPRPVGFCGSQSSTSSPTSDTGAATEMLLDFSHPGDPFKSTSSFTNALIWKKRYFQVFLPWTGRRAQDKESSQRPSRKQNMEPVVQAFPGWCTGDPFWEWVGSSPPSCRASPADEKGES